MALGSCAAFAVHRFRFFGRAAISFALVLPIALPGIVTAIALSSAIEVIRKSGFVDYGIWPIITAARRSASWSSTTT